MDRGGSVFDACRSVWELQLVIVQLFTHIWARQKAVWEHKLNKHVSIQYSSIQYKFTDKKECQDKFDTYIFMCYLLVWQKIDFEFQLTSSEISFAGLCLSIKADETDEIRKIVCNSWSHRFQRAGLWFWPNCDHFRLNVAPFAQLGTLKSVYFHATAVLQVASHSCWRIKINQQTGKQTNKPNKRYHHHPKGKRREAPSDKKIFVAWFRCTKKGNGNSH